MRLWVAVLAVVWTTGVAWADELLDYLCGVGDFQVVRRERTVLPPEAGAAGMSRALNRGVIGFNIGGLIPLAARRENPAGALAMGFLLRFPLRPGLPVGRFEISTNFAVTKMLRDKPTDVKESYEEYWELGVCYLGHFSTARFSLNPFWGVGLGYAAESEVREGGSDTRRDTTPTALLIAKVGWDTLRGISLEFSIRWLLNSDCNISSMAALLMTVYF